MKSLDGTSTGTGMEPSHRDCACQMNDLGSGFRWNIPYHYGMPCCIRHARSFPTLPEQAELQAGYKERGHQGQYG